MTNHGAIAAELPEKSLDFRLFCAFHACMGIAIAAHFFFKVGLAGEVGIACTAAVVSIVLSIRHRKKHAWHWPGARIRDALWAFAAVLLVVFFFGAALPGRSPLDPKLFPWCAAGACILLFAVLSGLHVVCELEKDFLRQCEDGPKEIMPSLESPPLSWKRLVINAFQLYFLLVWVVAVGFFWKANAAINHGSPVATATQTEKVSNRGQVAYITPQEKQLIHLLQYSLTVGIPSALVIGAFLHFVAGVKVLSQTPR
jgi:hypothetical protein